MQGAGASALFNFLLPQEELERTPSRKCGVSADDELDARALGCELVADAAALLRLPQVCVARAQVLFHRLYYRASVTEFDVGAAALAALFLSCKLEERPKKLRQLLPVFHRVCHRRRSAARDCPKFDCSSRAYFRVRAEVIDLECRMLKELGFLLFVEHPHKYVLFICRLLVGKDKRAEQQLAQGAWAYLNDSLRAPICCRFPANVIACAAVWLSARRAALPCAATEVLWWRLFDVCTEDLLECVKGILAVYTSPKPQYKRLCTVEGGVLPSEFSLVPEAAVAGRGSNGAALLLCKRVAAVTAAHVSALASVAGCSTAPTGRRRPLDGEAAQPPKARRRTSPSSKAAACVRE
eukprot:TRINITY_DN28145_c0_g1_i1.p1 TRINITY_DN28145_c0_g1~~TRINITY_DN28145_c0_g1_i1.p1  ORF type:complete len:352 (+),score=119.23 TRINITY_DN28145_c0_g1_i1:155-1210(+)